MFPTLKSEPTNHTSSNHSPKIPKKFQKNSPKISKMFFKKIPQKFSKKFWLAIKGRNLFQACSNYKYLILWHIILKKNVLAEIILIHCKPCPSICQACNYEWKCENISSTTFQLEPELQISMGFNPKSSVGPTLSGQPHRSIFVNIVNQS